MKKLSLFSATLLFILFANAQIVNIPDTNFKAALIAHNPVIDTSGDGEIQVSEASAYTGNINVFNENISDLTGIEAFIALTDLNCCYNQLSTLDVSNNTALTNFYCNNNLLSSLNVNNNTALTDLQCCNNQLTTLDISNNTALTYLYCENNQLDTLDVSNNTALTYLICDYNQLSSLDVSNNTALTDFCCNNNLLSSLNAKNGNNYILSFFVADNNPNLFCIEVDDSTWSTANWAFIDPQSYFSEDCSTSGVKEIQRTELRVYPNPTTGKIRLQAEGVERIEIMDIQGKQIYTGIKKEINLSNNSKGIYFIKVTTEKGVAVGKMVLE